MTDHHYQINLLWPLFFIGVVVPPEIAKGIHTNYVDRRLLESCMCVGINSL